VTFSSNRLERRFDIGAVAAHVSAAQRAWWQTSLPMSSTS
jgi:hypothetical protein